MRGAHGRPRGWTRAGFGDELTLVTYAAQIDSLTEATLTENC
jgi:hypothetical protein